MERTEILSLSKNTPADGTEITVCGWAKNIRDSKNIGFIALSDGGCFKTLQVVLDVHRDAIETENGSRMAPVCTVDGRQAAQVMIICGCDNGTTVQLPDWRQNLRVAAAWERAMEGMYPGFTRPVLFSYRFYNQDLTTGSLLIEIGGHGNNLNEALYAGQLAAKGLAAALLGGA